jgi:hypothetical protein
MRVSLRFSLRVEISNFVSRTNNHVEPRRQFFVSGEVIKKIAREFISIFASLKLNFLPRFLRPNSDDGHKSLISPLFIPCVGFNGVVKAEAARPDSR